MKRAIVLLTILVFTGVWVAVLGTGCPPIDQKASKILVLPIFIGCEGCQPEEGEDTGLCDIAMSGPLVVPAVATTATGTATFKILGNDVLLTIVHTVANPTASHIHSGAPGVNGPVVINLGNASSPISVTLSQLQYTQVIENPHYISVHSTLYPGGEVRGDITGCDPLEVKNEF